mmetsp:Transcript_36855/g.86082  ORF Transcript_36855/g.86082 Transcript_36855/m.86082 type:complete len:85 (+) Transcript_36855:81-335(+)
MFHPYVLVMASDYSTLCMKKDHTPSPTILIPLPAAREVPLPWTPARGAKAGCAAHRAPSPRRWAGSGGRGDPAPRWTPARNVEG